MDIQILTQPILNTGKEYTLGNHLQQLLTSKRPKFAKATFFFGLVKDSAFENLLEYIKSFILNGGELSFYLSQSQKGNTKKIVNSLLELGCEVFLFKNESKDFISDFQYKGAIFENSKKSILLLSSGNFSSSGLFEGYNVVTEFTYDLENDKEEFEKTRSALFADHISSYFDKVNRDNFASLFSVEIPSIEEFTRKDVDNVTPIVTAINDINIDIEIDDNVEFLVPEPEIEKPKKSPSVVIKQEKKVLPEPIEAIEFEETKYYSGNDALDIENMLFEASSKKENIADNTLGVINTPLFEETLEEKTEETKIIAKSTNLSKTSIFMLQLPKITKKGTSTGEIKIPSYLRDLIPAFWGWPKEYSVQRNSNEKLKICKFKIIDTIDANNIIVDENVKLFQREDENSFIILSEKLIELDLHENDIMRFIKTESADGSYFTCEIIRTDANEYPIWEQFCTSLLKGSKRKYGMM